MHRFQKAIITGFFSLALMGAGNAQAFSFGDSSFSFSDDRWGPGWGDPYYGRGYGYNRGYRGNRGYPGRSWGGPGWGRNYGPSFSNRPWQRDRRYFPRYPNYDPRMTPPPAPQGAPGGCPAETGPAN